MIVTKGGRPSDREPSLVLTDDPLVKLVGELFQSLGAYRYDRPMFLWRKLESDDYLLPFGVQQIVQELLVEDCRANNGLNRFVRHNNVSTSLPER